VPKDVSKLIARAARAKLGPLGLLRRGQSRLWIDDRGWWTINVEFQPSRFTKRSYLNVGHQHLWVRRNHLGDRHARPPPQRHRITLELLRMPSLFRSTRPTSHSNILLHLSTRGGVRPSGGGSLAADLSDKNTVTGVHIPSTPLDGYEIIELAVRPNSPAAGMPIGQVHWPPGSQLVAVSERRELVTPRCDMELHAGDGVVLLTPMFSPTAPTDS
jgi:TrkA-C domain